MKLVQIREFMRVVFRIAAFGVFCCLAPIAFDFVYFSSIGFQILKAPTSLPVGVEAMRALMFGWEFSIIGVLGAAFGSATYSVTRFSPLLIAVVSLVAVLTGVGWLLDAAINPSLGVEWATPPRALMFAIGGWIGAALTAWFLRKGGSSRVL